MPLEKCIELKQYLKVKKKRPDQQDVETASFYFLLCYRFRYNPVENEVVCSETFKTPFESEGVTGNKPILKFAVKKSHFVSFTLTPGVISNVKKGRLVPMANLGRIMPCG